MKATLILSVILALFTLSLTAEEESARDQVKAYLEAAKRGEAGINPKLQTRARGGDPEAIREVARQHHSNNLQRQVREGSITQDEANRLKAEYARIRELRRIAEETERQTEEIQRIRQEQERQHWNRQIRKWQRRTSGPR